VAATVSEFVSDMAEAYAWADLVVCRAGALTVSELAAAGVGGARPLSARGRRSPDPQPATSPTPGCSAAAAAGADRERLAQSLAALSGDRPRLLAMAQAARRLARPTPRSASPMPARRRRSHDRFDLRQPLQTAAMAASARALRRIAARA